MSGPLEDGVAGYLIYLVVALLTGIFSLYQKHVNGLIQDIRKLIENERKGIAEAKDMARANTALVRAVETEINNKSDVRLERLETLVESRRQEAKVDMDRLSSKIDSHYSDLRNLIEGVGRAVRNGKG